MPDTVPLPLNRTVPLLCEKLPPVNAALLRNSSTPEVEVKVVPELVNMPETVILAEPPLNVPAANDTLPDTVMALAFCEIVPVYPTLTVMLATLTAASILQLPSPPLSKMTASPDHGTEAPANPPEVVDQLRILFQLDRIEPTQ